MAAMLPAADRRRLGPAAQAVRRQFGIAGRDRRCRTCRQRLTQPRLRSGSGSPASRTRPACGDEDCQRRRDVADAGQRSRLSSRARQHVPCAIVTIARLAAGQTVAEEVCRAR
jgi:hypothetical protein